MSQRISYSLPSKEEEPVDVGGLHVHLLHRAGHLIEAVASIQSEFPDIGLEFPSMIVVGQESTGKSSVLERIAMIPILPRDEHICTRMPVHLRLRHLPSGKIEDFAREHKQAVANVFVRVKLELVEGTAEWSPFFQLHEVCSFVKKSMDDAVKARNQGKLQGIIRDTLIVEINSPFVPNLTLIDLPGIVSASLPNEPEDMMKQTRGLVESYLKRPHTLVLVILPSYERIRNSQAMQLIQQYKKEGECVGVLTMADKAYLSYRPDDPLRDLKERLNGTAGDVVPLSNGYVAVKNKDTTIEVEDRMMLKDIAQQEVRWFREHLPGYIEEGKASSSVLIEKLVNMMCSYIEHSWVPATEAIILKKMQGLRAEEDSLGSDPATLKLEDLLRRASTICTEHWKNRTAALFPGKLAEQSAYVRDTASTISLESTCAKIILKSNHVQECLKFFDAASSSLRTFLLQLLQADSQLPLMLKRFSRFNSTIRQALEHILTPSIQKAKAMFSPMIEAIWVTTPSDYSGSGKISGLACSALLMLYTEQILLPLFQDFASHLTAAVSGRFLVQELLQEDFPEKRKHVKATQETLRRALAAVQSMRAPK